MPLVKKDGQPELAREIAAKFRDVGLNVSYDDKQSIGKRYAKHDEIGTPYCLTVDSDSINDQCITIRNRDNAEQERIAIDKAIETVQARIAGGAS